MNEDKQIVVSATERRWLVGELRLMGYDIVPYRPRNKDYQVIILQVNDDDDLKNHPLYVRTHYDLRTEMTTLLIEGLLINARIQEGDRLPAVPSDLPAGERNIPDAQPGTDQRNPIRTRQKPRTQRL